MSILLLVGTAKGLFRFHSSDRKTWETLGPVLTGSPIYAAAYSDRSRTLFAGANSVFYGPSIRRSSDLGETWDLGGAGLAYASDDPEKLTRVWSILPDDATGIVYAGVEASGLFRSEDGGDTWAEISSLRDHPTHELWVPGNGGKCLHTVAVDPFDAETLYVAASTGGVYLSGDRGAHWEPANRGIDAEFMPEDQRYPEAGQCVHKFALSRTQRGRLWLQNHGGVFRSDDGGALWHDISQGLPDNFGFPVVGHPLHGDTAFVVPLTSSMERWVPEQKLRVYRTDDGGEHWRPLGEGLPEHSYDSVLRDAFRGDEESPQGLYLGTTSGSVYASADEGESFATVAEHLPRILTVVAVTLP